MPFVLPFASKISPPSDGIIRDGLISRWPFDDGVGSTTARDDQGSNTGTLDPSMDPQIAWVEGRLGGDVALEFSENTHGVSVPNVAALNPAAISITGWFKATTTISHWGSYLIKADDNWAVGYGIFQSGDFIRFFYGDFRRDAIAALTRQDRNWHFVIGTFDGANTKEIYLDNVQGTPNTESESPQNTPDPLSLGVSLGGANVYGIFQDWRIYNRVLSAGERTAIFTGTG